MKRRNVMKAALIGTMLAPLGLAACANTQAEIADAKLIVQKFQSFLPLLSAIPDVPAADAALITTLSNDLSQAVTLAGTLYPDIAPSAAASTLQNVAHAIEGALTIATTPPVSTLIACATAALPWLGALPIALQAAAVLVPVLYTDFGLPAPAAASPGGMTPAQARAILAS